MDIQQSSVFMSSGDSSALASEASSNKRKRVGDDSIKTPASKHRAVAPSSTSSFSAPPTAPQLPTCYLAQMPDDVLGAIIEFCDGPCLQQLRLASRAMHDFLQLPRQVRHALKIDFAPQLEVVWPVGHEEKLTGSHDAESFYSLVREARRYIDVYPYGLEQHLVNCPRCSQEMNGCHFGDKDDVRWAKPFDVKEGGKLRLKWGEYVG
jgi:hypothetical protein